MALRAKTSHAVVGTRPVIADSFVAFVAFVVE
jgi:hypothetical protein